ncbi:putative transcriptional regulator [Endobacter medicaginis]|uniref:Putative transcriptional regulator n=2 Tax=Endobacter medicaginis TaxID=1181271 RepID=A0A839UW03_9PROT|nr:MucR family transcriptional regulator [Endobacter medicaginis]MBB3172230.1 putative transcriptional regulator [Endobacter medicaginis]MCX5474650.1 MucR family transcriptional regulator [Endobacter medicaginis]
MTEDINKNDLLALTAQIVSAHLSNNAIEPSRVTALITEVYQSLRSLGEPAPEPAPAPVPAVPIKKSVFPDYLICLEDGKKLKMLKRHLMTTYDLTPDAYRQKWGLPSDYPMVAPNYAAHRSSLARKIGLGRRQPVQSEPAPARRGRRAKAPVEA